MYGKVRMRRLVLVVAGLLVTLTLTACGLEDDVEDALEPMIEEAVEATAIEAGNTLATSELSGAFEHPATDETVSGTLEWVDPSTILEEDTEVRWRFTPDEADLLEIEGTIVVAVTDERDTKDENGDDTENGNGDDTKDTDPVTPLMDGYMETEFLTSGETLSDTSLEGSFIDPDTNTPIQGTLEWVEPTATPLSSGGYGWRFIPDDKDAYREVTGTVHLKVDPGLEQLSLEDSYKEGGMTFEVYEVDTEDRTETPLHDMLLNRDYEPFEPSTGLETYITAMADTAFGGNYYKSDTTYLYVYQPSDEMALAVTVEIPIETLMRRLGTDDDPLPDEDRQGEDFEGIPRYDGSVILADYGWLSNMKAHRHHISYPWDGGQIKYAIHEDDASPEDIYGFYKVFFTDGEDWEVTHDTETLSGHYELVVEKEGMHIGVRTFDSSYAYSSDIVGYFIYKQTWTHDAGPLPEDDNIDDPELLSRFPGSVALHEDEEMFFQNRHQMSIYREGYSTEYREIVYGAEASVREVYNHFLNTFKYDDDWIWMHSSAGNTNYSNFMFSNMLPIRAYKDGYRVEVGVFEHSEYEDAVSYAVLVWKLPDLPKEDVYTSGDDPENVPRHPDSVLVFHGETGEKDDVIHHDTSKHIYAMEKPLLDVRDYYLENLPDGWEITENDTFKNFFGEQPILFILAAESDEEYLIIQGEYGNRFKHATTTRITLADKLDPLPGEDLEGEDFDMVERFPGSIIYHQFDELDIHQALGYSAEARLSDVYDYYLNDHFDDTWTLVFENYQPSKENSTFTVHYRKDDFNVEISGDEGSQYQNAVNYFVEVYYGGEGDLPEEDLMGEDFDAVERYPGSVILLAEQEMLIYGTMDSLEDVRTHYEEYLNAEGWNIIETNEEETEFDMSAIKGMDTVLMIKGTTESDYEDAVEITIVFVD